jgi:hypothetical protein
MFDGGQDGDDINARGWQGPRAIIAVIISEVTGKSALEPVIHADWRVNLAN